MIQNVLANEGTREALPEVIVRLLVLEGVQETEKGSEAITEGRRRKFLEKCRKSRGVRK